MVINSQSINSRESNNSRDEESGLNHSENTSDMQNLNVSSVNRSDPVEFEHNRVLRVVGKCWVVVAGGRRVSGKVRQREARVQQGLSEWVEVWRRSAKAEQSLEGEKSCSCREIRDRIGLLD